MLADAQFVTDADGWLHFAAVSQTGLAGSDARVDLLTGWYRHLPYADIHTVLHLGGMAHRVPNGDPHPLEAAYHYPRQRGVETWNTHPLEWEPVMRCAWPRAKKQYWWDCPPIIPVVHGRDGRIVAAVVCHYDTCSSPPEKVPLKTRVRALSLPPSLPVSLPKILLIGGVPALQEQRKVYDAGSMAALVGTFYGDSLSGIELHLRVYNQLGSIDEGASEVTRFTYEVE